jgi:hypothetical protein
LVVFVDALGPDQLARHGEGLAFLPHSRPLRGVLGYSSGALATVLTGAPPQAHGRMCLFSARQPDASGILEPLRWLGLLPRIVHERGRFRHAVSKAFAKSAGLTGYVALHRVPPDAFRWLDIPERDDLFHTDAVGDASTFLSDAREAGLTVYAAPWKLPEPERWEHTHRAIESLQPDLAFLYAAELDAALHMEGSRGDRAGEVLQRIGAHIQRAREAMAAQGGDLTTLVVGDHGMADVHTFIDPRPVLHGMADRAFVDSTMMRFWGDDRQLDEARWRVEAAGFPGRWLPEQALRSREVPMEGAPYGRGMFLLDEGAIFAPSYVGGKVLGMHGYDVRDHSARAALASDTPIPQHCDSIASVAGIVRERLGLT